jgi:hypothetical protein
MDFSWPSVNVSLRSSMWLQYDHITRKKAKLPDMTEEDGSRTVSIWRFIVQICLIRLMLQVREQRRK